MESAPVNRVYHNNDFSRIENFQNRILRIEAGLLESGSDELSYTVLVCAFVPAYACCCFGLLLTVIGIFCDSFKDHCK